MTSASGVQGDRLGFAAFERLTAQQTNPDAWPNCVRVTDRVPVYDGDRVRVMAEDPALRAELLSEWGQLLETGPGVFAITAAVADLAVLDRASEIFTAIIDDQHRRGDAAGDHFAKPGANDRVWNSFEKHALADPHNFVSYYSATPIAMAAEAWLGPAYQMTTQVNRVNPGGAAQVPHRDYHLGFMSPEQAARYPMSVHRMSPHLTLQGAVAHCDMPIETGPTMYLPYSQIVDDGYMAFGQRAYQDLFADRYVQLPLRTGDAVFFNPALMHGAGENQTPDVLRMANLLQVCSAFTRPMETVDRDTIALATLHELTAAAKVLGRKQLEAVIAAVSDGYAFPTNLDRDPPLDGLAPASHSDIVRTAVSDGWGVDRLRSALAAARTRRASS